MTRPSETQSYRERPARPEIARYLSSVWVQRVPASAQPYRHLTVPNGAVEIICRVGSGPPLVVGPRRGPEVGTVAPESVVVGIRFHPGAGPAILGIPASELVDGEIELEQLWGHPAVELAERLAGATSPGDAAAVLERAILTAASSAEDLDPLVAELVRGLQPWHPSGVVHSDPLFISPRQLRRRCLVAVGLGPKTLHRILRFQGFLALVNAEEAAGSRLAALAARSGYADQSHLTRECSRLSGLSPGRLLHEMATSCTPTHDHRASFA